MKASTVAREWGPARAKVDAEGVCRVCGKPPGPGRTLEAAYVVGRAHDNMLALRDPLAHLKVSALLVHPDRIIPLCGPSTSTSSCHGQQHAGRLDLLPFLSRGEQVQAVADCGSIASAFRRLAGGGAAEPSGVRAVTPLVEQAR